ncbi:MAG TPA: helix-turn-helix domain-containing protein [Blastocatellia bacterium]|jgi:hypothetical protein|nr:helix-turn-helix domain-containing protein [Blastocatellia bacterium]
MKKSFEFTGREIDDDIRAQVSRVFHEARWVITQLVLPGAEVKSPTIEQTAASPLAGMMRDVFDHAAGLREVPDVYSTCTRLLRLLFGKAPTREDEVPPLFWATPLGAAIRECSGSFAGLSDDEMLSEPEAARLLGVGQMTLLGYSQSGELPPAGCVGPRRLYTVGQVKEFRRRSYGRPLAGAEGEGESGA